MNENFNTNSNDIINLPDYFTKDNIEKVIEENEKIAKNNEDISHLRSIQETDFEEKELQSEIVSYPIGNDGKPNYTIPSSGELKEADIDITESDSFSNNLTNEKAKNIITNSPNGIDLSDEEAENIAKILVLYRTNPDMNVYAELCPSMRARIHSLCLQSNLPLSEKGMVAKFMIDQFLKEAKEDEEFIDIEKALNKAMKIPSLMDIYSEHINETMSTRIPAAAEELRKTDPDKADALLRVCNEYNNAFLYSRLIEMYDTKSQIRKAVRKDYSVNSIKKRCANVNYFNEKTKFKMPDAFKLIPVLSRILKPYYGEIVESDIQKFMTLVLESICYIDFNSVEDNSYVYYLLKNISMLSYVGDNLSDFSAELISNIITVIFYIRIKEGELNGGDSSSKHKRQHKTSSKN